jgi:iron(II)-dependent oxidoreductase
MLLQLVESVPDADAACQYHPQLGSLSWYLGRSVYQELFWLRETLAQDRDLSARIEHLFSPGRLPLAEQCTLLPPKDHLLNWAHEILEHHLVLLANPGQLPAHPLLEQDRLPWFLLQEHGRNYEAMLMVLVQRSLSAQSPDYRVKEPLRPQDPRAEAKEITQGHYRIGARGDPAAYDNELPPQAVQLSSFRIATRPTGNAEFLAFMEAGGYSNCQYWTETGWDWQTREGTGHPQHWVRDNAGNWYGMGVNGPSDLAPEQPVMGINQHEAKAYANWVAGLGESTAGAVLVHEYQWELAARSGAIAELGRAWEWCSNLFHPYPEFQAFPSAEVSEHFFDQGHVSLRGASLHTQPSLRRASFRNHASPEQQFLFAGTRLVFPPTG